MDDSNLNLNMLRDNRYDAVMHMVTAADGAQEFYDSISNEARYESVEEAIDKDKKIREAYMGHKRWVMIDNSVNDFQQKINNAKTQIQHILGHSTGSNFYKKYLLNKCDGSKEKTLTNIPIKFGLNQIFEESSLDETFIKYSSTEGKVISASIEKKGSNLSYAYTLKATIQKGDQRINKKKVISASEYIELMQNKIQDMQTLHCNRVCTIDQGLYMIIDYYPQVDGEPVICIIQVNAEELKKTGKRVSLPKYLNIK